MRNFITANLQKKSSSSVNLLNETLFFDAKFLFFQKLGDTVKVSRRNGDGNNGTIPKQTNC
ncbi:hypothetical protein K5E_08690 [Enterococcus thailandicus]|uniref:Uncharacterized protein n=1 Tax=Enterococcus thailandicus TaxID=417368 RepID=A0A510WBS6_ENTTH|nr:hypothetical protein ETH01_08930 [Enterococcus thailandicus]GMC03255.1 hypothetical protein K4E_07750 [Enterococcus thailandicus]GMC08730.1 hypothetical protein K5E_08690 [Enterococcus thailandicus]